jgi:hypothetical protein
LLWFATSAGGFRFVRIEVDTRLSTDSLTALIGHELYHAYEVSLATSVVDPGRFEDFYREIGEGDCRWGQYVCYETSEATRAGVRISKELSSNSETELTRP